jgi:RND family efflux transporter MFP subunit
MVLMNSNFPSMRQLCFAVAALCAAISLTACEPSAAAKDPRTEARLVEIATVQPAGAAERAFTGIVKARVQSNLTFRVPGKVTERLVDTGEIVRSGQALMRIDRTDYAHAITAHIGNVAAAKARLGQAAADAARYRDLVSSGAVSRSAYDQAKAAADSARALLSAAEAQLRVAQDEGEYSTLLADADGAVVETLAEPGQFVAAGQTVLKLAHAGPREAAINLPEILRPAIGSIAGASLYGTTARMPARLRQLSDAADPLTRTFDARYVLGGPAAQAPLGATVTVYLPAAAPVSAMSVPLGAIDDEGNGPGVWVLIEDSSSVSFRPVDVLQLGAESATLSKGLHVGEQIVALGGHFLHEGERVRVAQAETAQQ